MLADEPPHRPIAELVEALAPELILVLGGSPRYRPHGGNQWTEEEAERMMALLPPADVLLTHSPPAGVNDEPDDRAHRGSPALRDWVERHQPGWLLHGHTLPHPGRAVRRLGPTRVVHVRGAVPIELG